MRRSVRMPTLARGRLPYVASEAPATAPLTTLIHLDEARKSPSARHVYSPVRQLWRAYSGLF
jgi:hypothetical protein